MTFSGVLSLLYSLGGIVALLLTIGAIAAFRYGYVRQIGEAQEKTIAALKALTEAQEAQIAAKDKEIARLGDVIDNLVVQAEAHARIKKRQVKAPEKDENA